MVRGFDLFGGGGGVEGTSSVEQVSSTILRITVSGLGFTPAHVFAKLPLNVHFGSVGWTGVHVGVVNGETYPVSISYSGLGTVTITSDVSYNSNGFVLTITGSRNIMSSSGITWYCYGE